MAYSKEQIETIFNTICSGIEKGMSLRSILKSKDMPSSRTFFKWVDSDDERVKQYARAMEDRADKIFEDILYISDDSTGDNAAFVGVNRIHRHKLQIDARKWMLSKMMPTKYGDKLELNNIINDKRKTVDSLFPDEDELDAQS